MDTYADKSKQELIEIIKRLEQVVDGAIDALQRQIDDADAKTAHFKRNIT